ncbi:TnsA-like heteromeric transposase endonuclease subunit [Actinomadura sp. KC345]|uniref:TnsA-like heteromeric transposase endonuclease subunit n=1 Tax=Actinomadura sp. KC345 TaxID=2530371 RepID=UPI001044C361|nr:TnsA-like heteromeric transposase endonuclease subunit [Actinomadura sp. KC345]TDC41244.1 TnsA-like heteromeric transposase endonuclease subunit [Actinomadura sp. KC345]
MRWKTADGELVCAVRDAAEVPVEVCRPVRSFSWRTDQSHRPGLAAMVRTGRLHGFESLNERKLLLALDFLGDVQNLLSQPMTLRFTTSPTGSAAHTPDFLVVTGGGVWLLDVRPAGLIGAEDRVKFAATAELALACGWQYIVVAGWWSQVQATLDALSAARRQLQDPLGLQERLLAVARREPLPFGELVGQVPYPAIGRAHAVHLLWRRRLGMDLRFPLSDRCLVWAASRSADR